MGLYNVDLSFDNRRFMYKDFDYGHRVIFLHLYKEVNKWKNHLMSYLERITGYRYHKLNGIIIKQN